MSNETAEPSGDDALRIGRVEVVDEVGALAVDGVEVARYLGYPAGVVPNRRFEEMLDRWIRAARERAAPRAVYAVFPVAGQDERRLRLETPEGVAEFHGGLSKMLGRVRRIVAFIATAGPGVERLASRLLREGEELAALIVDAVGAERASAAETAVRNRLSAEADAAGLAATWPYSPGYCGMALTEQKKLFALFRGQTIGVTLSEACLMQPLKSISGLIGLGRDGEIQSGVSPCERCDMEKCMMRR